MACRARGLAGHRLRARRRFFERLLGLGVGFRVLRAHRQPAKSERGQLLAHGPLVHRDAEALLDPALQVDAPPAHHPVRGGVGTLARHARQFRPPSRARSRRGPRPSGGSTAPPALRRRSGEPGPQRLPVHATALGRGLAVHPLQHQRERQHAPRRLGILRLRRRSPKLTRRKIRSCDRNRHRNLHASMGATHSGEPKGIPRESQTGAVGMIGHPQC